MRQELETALYHTRVKNIRYSTIFIIIDQFVTFEKYSLWNILFQFSRDLIVILRINILFVCGLGIWYDINVKLLIEIK